MNRHLNINDWAYLSQGAQSIAFQFKENKILKPMFVNKVLILKKLDQNTSFNTEEIKFINRKLRQQHVKIIEKIDNITKYTLKYQILQLTEAAKSQFLQEVASVLQVTQRKGNHRSQLNSTAPIRICDNVFKSHLKAKAKQTIIFEFKPKSIMFTKYPREVIESVSEHLKIDYDVAVDILENSPDIQKTRWFKSRLVKDTNKISPFDYFNYCADGYLDKIPGVKVVVDGQVSSLNKVNNKGIYDRITNKLFEQSKLFEEVAKLQKLYWKSYWLFKDFSQQKIVQEIRRSNFNQIVQNLQHSLLNNQIIKQTNCQIDDSIIDDKIGLDIMRSLMSTAWRDFSLIVQINILDETNQQIKKQTEYTYLQIDGIKAACKLTIIDYHIGPISKLFIYQQKQSKLLQSYLEYKIGNRVK